MSLKKCPFYGDVRFIEYLPKIRLFHGGVYDLEIPVKCNFLGLSKAILWLEKRDTKLITEMVVKTEHCLS